MFFYVASTIMLLKLNNLLSNAPGLYFLFWKCITEIKSRPYFSFFYTILVYGHVNI